MCDLEETIGSLSPPHLADRGQQPASRVDSECVVQVAATLAWSKPFEVNAVVANVNPGGVESLRDVVVGGRLRDGQQAGVAVQIGDGAGERRRMSRR